MKTQEQIEELKNRMDDLGERWNAILDHPEANLEQYDIKRKLGFFPDQAQHYKATIAWILGWHDNAENSNPENCTMDDWMAKWEERTKEAEKLFGIQK